MTTADRHNGEMMCFDAWLDKATPAELARFDQAMAAKRRRRDGKKFHGEELDGFLHERLGDFITDKNIGLRELAQALRRKADEIERHAPRDWQIVADAASEIEEYGATPLHGNHFAPILEEFEGATSERDGFEAYAIFRLARAVKSASDKYDRVLARLDGARSASPDDGIIPF